MLVIYPKFVASKQKNTNMSNNAKKHLWGQIINIIVAVLSAVATTFGLNSCVFAN